jgi:hypothetical protein
MTTTNEGRARGGTSGCGTALQAGRSGFPFFIDLVLPTVGTTQPLTKMSTRVFAGR